MSIPPDPCPGVLLRAGGFGRLLLQDEFLHPPGFDFTHDDLVGIAAIHHVDDLEIGRVLARAAKLADHGAVQFGLVDFAGDVPRARYVAVRVRVRMEHILVRARRNADCPADAKIGDLADRFQIVVEHLVAEVRAVGDPDIALAVDLHAVRQVELAKALTGFLAAGLRQEAALGVVFHDAIVAVAVGDEDVALRVPAHIGRTAEDVFFRRRIRAGAGGDGAADRWRPAAKHHQHLTFGAELGDHVGTFIDRPDIVLRIDADGVRELKAVITLAYFPHETAVLVEFPELRSRRAAVVDEDMALGIGRDRNRFAEIFAGRDLEEIRHRRNRDFRNPGDCGLQLRHRRAGGQNHGSGETRQKIPLHKGLPGVRQIALFWRGYSRRTIY